MLQTTASFAQSSAVPLDGPKSSEELQPYISYYLDSGWERSVSQMLNEYRDAFKPIETSDPDFGYTNDRIWLRLVFQNQTQLEEDWRLYFRENFKQLFDVYVVRENFSVENVLSQDLERGFKTRSVQYPELVAPVTIEPGETVTLLVRYWSEGASHIPVTMETGPSFAEIAAKRTAKNFIYYGMMLLLIAAAFIALLVYGHFVFAAYIAYAGSTLLFLMHSDGVAYQYLWPDYPKFNSMASIVTGSSIIVFACVYARSFLLTRLRHPIVDKMLLAVIFVTLALDVSAFFVDNQIIKKWLVLCSLIAVSACTISAIVAARSRFKEVRFFLLAWLGILVASGIMNLRHWVGIELSQDFQYDFMRFVMVFDAAMMGLAIGDRYNQLRQARQLATQKSLSEARRNLELTRRLGDLEKLYAVAVETTQSKDEQIANTIHDLRQPLHALRLNVGRLIDGEGERSSEVGDIDSSFTYLEELVSSHLDGSEPANSGSFDDDELSTNEVLRSIHDMFLPDAQAKGLEFVYVPTSLDADVEKLVLMRVITNLVSNAIKYTQRGKILLGCRRRGDTVRIEVHDTGPGLDDQEFEIAKKRDARLSAHDSDTIGCGYGLAIVSDLAEKHGFKLIRDDRRASGSGIGVELPRQYLPMAGSELGMEMEVRA